MPTGFSNVWRSLQLSPDAVARWCDWPVNHADLNARRRELLKNEGRLLEGLESDPTWHDPIMAGYWIWAASCWIGSGLTGGKKDWDKRPLVAHGGHGVHATGQRPHVGDGGKGVHALGQIPHIGHGGKGVQEPYNTNLYTWFRQLSERLRYVRVVCGDWTRVCGGKWQNKIGDVGIFFDPPYGTAAKRDANLYAQDSLTVAQNVQDWCRERGSWDGYRIVLAGYFEEHERLLADGWSVKRWTAAGGYGNTIESEESTAPGRENRKREALFFSPGCANGQTQATLF